MEEPMVKSVHKAIQILNCFKQKEEYSLAELTQLTGMNKSTLYGLIQSLHINGFLQQSEETRNYSLGIGIFELGSLYKQRLNISKIADPICQDLSEKFSATVNLTTYINDEVVYLDKYESPDTIISITFVGKRLPMSVTAVGKALLAYLGDDYFKKHISSKALPKYTDNSIVDLDQLIDELRLAKINGYAADYGESIPGIISFGAPIFNSTGVPIYAISAVVLEEQSSDDKNNDIIQALLYSSRTISELLGYNY